MGGWDTAHSGHLLLISNQSSLHSSFRLFQLPDCHNVKSLFTTLVQLQLSSNSCHFHGQDWPRSIPRRIHFIKLLVCIHVHLFTDSCGYSFLFIFTDNFFFCTNHKINIFQSYLQHNGISQHKIASTQLRAYLICVYSNNIRQHSVIEWDVR